MTGDSTTTNDQGRSMTAIDDEPPERAPGALLVPERLPRRNFALPHGGVFLCPRAVYRQRAFRKEN
jgi:hypothetical protein